MSEDQQLKEHALNASLDYYDFLGISPDADVGAIEKAYRKTTIKFHPDKATGSVDKFHLTQIARSILTDENLRKLFDNARRAREEKQQKHAALTTRQQELVEKLERSEADALERKRKAAREELEEQQERKRQAVDLARRRKEREEQRQREEAELVTRASNRVRSDVEIKDRCIVVRYWTDRATEFLGPPERASTALERDFAERFGPIESLSPVPHKIKVKGEKHRRQQMRCLIVFSSILGAFNAVTDFGALSKDEQNTEKWSLFDAIEWVDGMRPSFISRLLAPRSATVSLKDHARAIASEPKTPSEDELFDILIKDTAVQQRQEARGAVESTGFAVLKNSKARRRAADVMAEDERSRIAEREAQRAEAIEQIRRAEAEEDAAEAAAAAAGTNT